MSKLSAADLKVALALGLHADRNWGCRPSVARVADRSGLTERSTIRSLRRLEGLGLIQTIRGGGRGRASRYRVVANPDPAVTLSNPDPAVTLSRNPDERRPETLTNGALNPDGAVSRTVRTAVEQGKNSPSAQSDPKATERMTEDFLADKRDEAGRLFDDDADDPKPFDAGQAIGIFHAAYQEARGSEPDRPDGRTAGRLKRWIDKDGITSEAWRGRVRLAAGLDGRAPPWPFDRPGELTLSNIITHWAKLGDGLNGGRHDTRQRPPAGKYDHLG